MESEVVRELPETVKEPVKPIYEPGKSYQWKSGDTFPISGMEFEYIFKALSDILNSAEGIRILKLLEMHRIMEAKLREGVENGSIVEAKKTESS